MNEEPTERVKASIEPTADSKWIVRIARTEFGEVYESPPFDNIDDAWACLLNTPHIK